MIRTTNNGKQQIVGPKFHSFLSLMTLYGSQRTQNMGPLSLTRCLDILHVPNVIAGEGSHEKAPPW